VPWRHHQRPADALLSACAPCTINTIIMVAIMAMLFMPYVFMTTIMADHRGSGGLRKSLFIHSG
jgi:hypothetical protein